MKSILARLAGVVFVFGLVACGSSSRSADEASIEYVRNCFSGSGTEFLSNARGPNGTTFDKGRVAERTQDIAQLRSFAQARGGLKAISVLKSSNISNEIHKNLMLMELKVEFHNGEAVDYAVKVALIDDVWRVLVD